MTTSKIQSGPIGRDVIAPIEVLASRLQLPLRTIRRLIRQGMPARQAGDTILATAGDIYDRLEPVDTK